MPCTKFIGAHVSIAGGTQNAPIHAQAIGATAFGLFVKNQRQWQAKPLLQENIQGFHENCALAGISSDHILAHDSYLINLGHPDPQARKKSRDALLQEILRCEQLGIRMLNTHPGSHLRLGTMDQCLQRISESINYALDGSKNTKIVLENTAGQGSNVGFAFEQIAHIIDGIEDRERIGVCIDTCHAFAAGYDLRDRDSYDKTWRLFDSTIGASWLCALHLNDAKSDLNSHIDRHAPIGQGRLGMSAFDLVMNDPRFDHLPLILETPNSDNWQQEIELLSALQKGK